MSIMKIQADKAPLQVMRYVLTTTKAKNDRRRTTISHTFIKSRENSCKVTIDRGMSDSQRATDQMKLKSATFLTLKRVDKTTQPALFGPSSICHL